MQIMPVFLYTPHFKNHMFFHTEKYSDPSFLEGELKKCSQIRFWPRVHASYILTSKLHGNIILHAMSLPTGHSLQLCNLIFITNSRIKISQK